MTRRDDRDHVDFSPPDANEYQRRIAAAKDSHTPVGGAEMPNIPRLDQPPPGSRFDSVQGRGVRGPKSMTPDEYNQALASGKAVPGVGGAYQVNQPKGFTPPTQDTTPPLVMSSKDGTPVNPPRPEGGLRPETQEGLKAVIEANAADSTNTYSKDDEEYLRRLSEETQDVLHNKQRKDYIESQISDDLNFDDLLFQQELRQRVPIKKNFIPTFRTPSAAEDLFIKRLMGKEEGSAQYMLDKYGSMGLVCGLFAINGKPFPDHCDSKKTPTEDLFWAKYEMIMRYPLILVADLNANFIWFEERVKKLLSLESIKGF